MTTTNTTTQPGLVNNLASIMTPTKSVTNTAVGSGANGMGQSSFLKLFVTQLQNQDPLNPTDNQSFVAQLAQFSQLEATTNMSTQMSSLVTSLTGDQMLTGAALIGRQVAVPSVPAVVANGQPVTSYINLPNGADSLSLQFINSAGKVVRTDQLGTQPAGQTTETWNAKDDSGSTVPDGNYTVTAVAVVGGVSASIPVNTMTTVQSVTTNPKDSTLILKMAGGGTAPMSSVVAVGQ